MCAHISLSARYSCDMHASAWLLYSLRSTFAMQHINGSQMEIHEKFINNNHNDDLSKYEVVFLPHVICNKNDGCPYHVWPVVDRNSNKDTNDMMKIPYVYCVYTTFTSTPPDRQCADPLSTVGCRYTNTICLFFFINFVIVLRVICILRNQLYTHFASVCVYFPLLLSPLCFGRLLLRQFIGDYMISFVECIKRAIHLSKISRGDCKTSVSSTSAGRDANWGEWKYSSLKRSQKKWENIFVRNDAIAQLIRLMTWCGTDFYYLTMLLLRI